MPAWFALLVGVVVAVAGCGPRDGQEGGPGAPATRCGARAPTSPSGYAAMFARLPASQWAAGDGGITVPFGRRSIWLFGDTFSARPNGFVHSSAIVQNGGCL